jgi:putative transposase
MIEITETLVESIGVVLACEALGVPRSSFYRAQQQPEAPGAATKTLPTPDRALSEAERALVREVLNSPRFQDRPPRQVYAALLDQGIYLCSWRTMYRILEACGEVQERRNQLQHPNYVKPELLATGPNQLWSWDITKLRGPVTWTYYYLYTILDVFSRYVVGWMIAEAETAELAQQLIVETCEKQGIEPGQLTLHADRGAPMVSKTLAQLLLDLGVAKTHSRPYTSNDNPYSEAQFKTMKYRPDYPDRFMSPSAARFWAKPFFHWYNHEHYHTGLNLMTPAMVHYDQTETVCEQRNQVLQVAYALHPERFVQGPPQAPSAPTAVWINKPSDEADGGIAP